MLSIVPLPKGSAPAAFLKFKSNGTIKNQHEYPNGTIKNQHEYLNGTIKNHHEYQHNQKANKTNIFGASLFVAGCATANYVNKKAGLDSGEPGEEGDEEHFAKLSSMCSDVLSSGNTAKSRPFLVGQRMGSGKALAICRPSYLQEAVDVLQYCVDNNLAVITQGANTGLTGGSVPRPDIDRSCVVLNMRNLKTITPVGSDDDSKLVCLPGAGILDLSNQADKKGRESHSILGSVFLNPSVAAGIAFGSGGTQVRKGPAYTERVLYAKVGKDGKVEVVNNLGIKANSQAELFKKLESGDVTLADVNESDHKFWFDSYPKHVTKLDDDVARYNSYTGSKCEASRCEGKVLILASIHQTFPKAKDKEVYWVTGNNFQDFVDLRKRVVLSDSTGKTLPASCEYMNKTTIELTESHGAAACAAILIGGMKNLGRLYKVQAFADRFLPLGLSDTALYLSGKLVPPSFILPKSILKDRGNNHHVLLDISEYGSGEMGELKQRLDKYLEEHKEVKAVKLTKKEVVKSNIFRFTNAAAFKIYCLLTKRPGVSLDYALRKNHCDEYPAIPAPVHKRMIYGHFGCNVVHDDVCFEMGVDPHRVKYEVKKVIEQGGGLLPAEHGHGTEYSGTNDYKKMLMKLDPLNVMNPGVAGTSANKDYK